MAGKSNQQYFINTKFVKSVFDLASLPIDTCQEIAFAGRSNCGKSSIINAVTQKIKLAITSKTPGRTQSINYFQVTNQAHNNNFLVDLPGYGYAKVAIQTKKFWSQLIEQYLSTRHSLIGMILIMDIRHPLTDFDRQMLFFSSANNLPLYLILNKSDKLTKNQINATVLKVAQELKDLPNILIQPCSAVTLVGIKELQDQIINWFN
jgi:GTP-binding protein